MEIVISSTQSILSNKQLLAKSKCGCIFCFKETHVLLGNFCLSHIGKTSFLFLPYKGWTNGIRVPLVWWSFYCGCIFCFKETHVLVGNFCLSHIGKISFLFLPYFSFLTLVRYRAEHKWWDIRFLFLEVSLVELLHESLVSLTWIILGIHHFLHSNSYLP